MQAPSPQSCVDLLRSGLKEYMIAIKNAIDQRPVIRNALANCTCERHTRRRNKSVFEKEDTDGLVMWEDLLGGSTADDEARWPEKLVCVFSKSSEERKLVLHSIF